MSRPVSVGLIGLGTVGSQVADRMLSWGPQLSRRAGVELCLSRVLVRDLEVGRDVDRTPLGQVELCLSRVLVRDLAKRRPIDISPDLLTTDASRILDDPSIEVLIEVAGGDEPMRSYIERAIQSGKHVITANKVVMAK